MNLQDAVLPKMAPGIGDLHSLRLRMHLLEQEFQKTGPEEFTQLYLLHLELEKVYKDFMNCYLRIKEAHKTESR